MKVKVTFMPQNISIDVEEGGTVLEAAILAGVDIDGNCSGTGICGKCKVRIDSGDLTQCSDPYGKLTESEKKRGFRLACTHRLLKDSVVYTTDSRATAERKRKLIHLPEGFKPEPTLRKEYITVKATTLSEAKSDDRRVREALGEKDISFEVEALRNIAVILREQNDLTITLRNGRIIDAESGDHSRECYGLAIDVGTTTVVVMVWNLITGELKGVDAFTNPQANHGADVISRITYVMKNRTENLEKLRSALIDRINLSVYEFSFLYGIKLQNIYEVVVVGNTTMSTIFAGMDPSQLSTAPFAPIFENGVAGDASRFGITAADHAKLYISANIAGHVGSDITAGIITTDLTDFNEGRLFIDIGTNGEIVMTGNGKAVACSTAAGPAFEGSSIECGMRAANGAIERIDLSVDGVAFRTVGSIAPVGICGSGIFDAVGELVRVGIVDSSGRILSADKLEKKKVPEALISQIRTVEGVSDFCLYKGRHGEKDVYITQKDIREVQLAKAAIAAGIRILMKKVGITEQEIKQIIIAGAFGNYIRAESAIRIGILPDIDRLRIHSAGNAAGSGASMMLLSPEYRQRVEKTARRIRHVQLATEPNFQDAYMEAMRF